MMAKIKERDVVCVQCKQGGRVRSLPGSAEGAPELLEVPLGAWVAIVVTPAAEGRPPRAALVFACSEECAKEFQDP